MLSVGVPCARCSFANVNLQKVCASLWRLRAAFSIYGSSEDLEMGATDVVRVECADRSAAHGGRAATVA